MFLFIILLLIVTGCDKNKDEGNPLAHEEGRNDPIEEKEDDQRNELEMPPEDLSTFPFTGLETEANAKRRPVSVMVNNHPAARPQSGLSKADLVFEILVEGNITRFLAIFQSEQPEKVGPVRSAREYYFNLAEGYDALYVYHGAADFINDMILNRGIEHLSGATYDNDGKLFIRESFRKAPHNSYLLFDAVYEVAASKDYEIEKEFLTLPFLNDEEEIVGEKGHHIKIQYPGRTDHELVEFKYDSIKEKYYRFENGEQTIEFETEVPIEVDNVFILETKHEVIDPQGRRSIDLESGGKAYLIQKGKMQRLDWANEQGRMIPVKNGEPIGFVPGKTWVNIIPSSPGLDESIEVIGEIS